MWTLVLFGVTSLLIPIRTNFNLWRNAVSCGLSNRKALSHRRRLRPSFVLSPTMVWMLARSHRRNEDA